jgi:hypothetical protein
VLSAIRCSAQVAYVVHLALYVSLSRHLTLLQGAQSHAPGWNGTPPVEQVGCLDVLVRTYLSFSASLVQAVGQMELLGSDLAGPVLSGAGAPNDIIDT